MTHTNWWQSLFLCFSAVTWALAQPLYNFIIDRELFAEVSAAAVLEFMMVYQLLPLAVLFGLDRLFIRAWGTGKVLHLYRGALFVAAAMVFLRSIQVFSGFGLAREFNSLPEGLQLALSGGLLIAVMGIAHYFMRAATQLFVYLAVVSVVLTGTFIAQVGLLGKPWTNEPPVSVAQTQPTFSDQGPFFIIILDGLGGDVLWEDDGQGILGIDADLYPNFSALAEDGALFINATSNYLDSVVSIPSFMTGRFFPSWSEVDRGSSGAGGEGIFDVLVDSGLAVESFSNIFGCGDERFSFCLGRAEISGNVHRATREFILRFFPRKVNAFIRDSVLKIAPNKVVENLPIPGNHENSVNLWNTFLDRISGTGALGTAYFVHLLLPHQPYEFDRHGKMRPALADSVSFSDFQGMHGLYEEQVLFVDTLLGGFVDKLKNEGLYGRSTIIVTSDHGPRSLGLGEEYEGFLDADDFPAEISKIVPSVPLIIRGPGVEPRISNIEYQHIDLLPTVRELFDLTRDLNLPGVSAFDDHRPRRSKTFFGYPRRDATADMVSYTYDAADGTWKMGTEMTGN